jgi:hypothetical protein
MNAAAFAAVSTASAARRPRATRKSLPPFSRSATLRASLRHNIIE